MNKPNLVKRGLSDLLLENAIDGVGKEEVVEIDVQTISPNPFQPRKHFDVDALNELAESIRINGILQPIIVKKIAGGHMLVAGERRVRAAKIAGFSTVPAIVRDYNNTYLAELALLENIQREDLTIVEEAEAYKNAIESLNLTHLELSQKIGKSRSYVSNTLGILSLPEAILDLINAGNISMGHARALSKLKDVERIKKIAEMVVLNKLTVRDIEQLAKQEKRKTRLNASPWTKSCPLRSSARSNNSIKRSDSSSRSKHPDRNY
ncbi:MAG: ParB/RepB/Spo0J family partition protein [Bacillus subtilis]|nr:ParB/RepB/Spo0J family partition protein [Bacillus subtilis]